MRILKVCQLSFVLAVFALASSTQVEAKVGCVMLDPGTRHTNGMPIARSEPQRTNSVTWQCNPDNLGYCGCRYYWPCCATLRPRNVCDAARGHYTPRQLRGYKSYAGCVCPEHTEFAGIDGIEPPGMVQVGQVSNSLATPGLGGAGVPLSTPAGFPPGR